MCIAIALDWSLLAYIFCCIFTTLCLLVLYMTYIACDVMPATKISTICMCFFYSGPPQCSHCKCCTSYSISVCLSIRLSHAGIVSKRRHIARCSLHCKIAKSVSFYRNKKYSPGTTHFPWNLGWNWPTPPDSSESWHVLPCSTSTVRASEKKFNYGE